MGGLLPDMPNNVQMIVSKGVAFRGKPSTSFISPLNGQTVSGTVLISVKAASSISINGVKVSSTSTYYWNTTGLPSGVYTLTATGKTTASIYVLINTIIVDPPDPVEYTLIKPLPPVMNQGSEGSCVAFAVGYAARSVEWFNKTGTLKTFSPEHLYNNVKFGSCETGTGMQTALEFIMLNGILPLSEMPYTSGTCEPTETELQKQIALQYKIDGFYKMYTTDEVMIKSMVSQNKPVIISIVVDNPFMNATSDFTWSISTGNSLGHSVVIVGFDDKGYRIMNSWGTGWGGEGFAWITYDLFKQQTGTYCYSIK